MNSKKRLKKQVLSLILAVSCIFSMAGCSGRAAGNGNGEAIGGTETQIAQGGKEGARGRYMEKQLNTPEGMEQLDLLVRLGDGSLAAANQGTGEIYISKDEGESWEQKTVSPLDEAVSKDAEITSLALAPDGGAFFSYVLWSEISQDGDVEEKLVYTNADGEGREFSVNVDPEDYVIQGAVFNQEGKLYVSYLSGNVYQVNYDTGELKKQMVINDGYADSQLGLTVTGDYLISVTPQQIDIMKLSTGEILNEDLVLNEFAAKEIKDTYSFGVCFDEGEGTIYTASPSGLYSHVPEGSVMDQLLDGGLSNLGDPTKVVRSLLRNQDGSFLIAYEDGEIDSCVYDKDALSVPEKQLTVYSLEENDTINKAISTFRKNNPDVFVKREIGLTEEGEMTAEDAVRNLNTSILSGEGPDIIVLDGMPVDSYIEKGVLADLKDFIEKLQKNNSYFNNIFLTYENQEGVYALPARFQIPVMVDKQQNLDGIHSLSDFTERVLEAREEFPDGKTILGTYNAIELLVNLLPVNAPAWEEGGEFQKDALLEFFNQAETIYQAEHKNITQEMEQTREEVLVASNFGVGRTYAEANSVFGGGDVMDLLSGEAAIGIGKLNSMLSYEMLTGLMHTVEELGYALMPGQAEKVFVPVGTVGVNSKTKEEELSYAFLEELFGIEVQKNDLGDGFPVNQEAFAEYSKDPNNGSEVGFMASNEDGTGVVDFTAVWPNEEEISKLKELIGSLEIPSNTESVLETAVLDAGEKMLKGQMTPSEGADEISQKMDLYFAE